MRSCRPICTHFSDGVSYWDKQDQIHQSTHNHGDNSFIPWHRELVNRYEALFQQSNPDVALHYWDWTEDPTRGQRRAGRHRRPVRPSLLGTVNRHGDGALAVVHNGGALAGSREDTGDPADPHSPWSARLPSGDPGCGLRHHRSSPPATPCPRRNSGALPAGAGIGPRPGHGYIGGDIGAQHQAFEDPFVFLLHSNVDRLFAMWQTRAGQDWRLDPDQVYGDQSGHHRRRRHPADPAALGRHRGHSGPRSSRGWAPLRRSRSRTASTPASSLRPATTPCRSPSNRSPPLPATRSASSTSSRTCPPHGPCGCGSAAARASPRQQR